MRGGLPGRLLLTGALALPVVGVVAAGPAYAVDNVICITGSTPNGVTCDQLAANVPAAISAANGNAVDDTIWLGAATYSDGPYVLNGTVHELTLRGSGSATEITLPAPASAQTYITGNGVTLDSFRLTMTGTQSEDDTGLLLLDSLVQGVAVQGLDTTAALGAQVKDTQFFESSIAMNPDPLSGTVGMQSAGGLTAVNSSLGGGEAYLLAGLGLNPVDTLTRMSVFTQGVGIHADTGIVNVDSTKVVVSGTGGTGLLADARTSHTADKRINATNLTVVEDGGAGGTSVGVAAYADDPTAKQLAVVNLDSTVVSGFAHALDARATNDGAQGGRSDATVTTTYSNWDATGDLSQIDATTGTGGLVGGVGDIHVDPGFVNPVGPDYRLTLTSAMLDAGNPAITTGSALGGQPRWQDGDGDGTTRVDIGAYERPALNLPTTTITSGPTGVIRDTTPTFTFQSNDPGATFDCRIDNAPYAGCTGTFTTAVLGQGAHVLTVRARDASNNVDASPATRSFSVDSVGPKVTLSTKPAKKVVKRKAKFAFAASEPGSTFACAIDGAPLKACAARTSFKVALGRHKVLVRATDRLGNVGATVTYKFRRIVRPSNRGVSP